MKNMEFEERIENICKEAGLTAADSYLASQAEDIILEAISIASKRNDVDFINNLGEAYAFAYYAEMFNVNIADMDDYPFDMAKDYISNHS